jgi:quinoprotein glucose dehydrogenase
LSGRGVAYWTDGKGDERILYVTTGYRLIALNAKTGAMIPSFGTNGVVDLKVGVVNGVGKQIDLESGEIGLHSTPAVVNDVAIIGSSMKEGFTPVTHNTKGLVRIRRIENAVFNTISGQVTSARDVENDSRAVNAHGVEPDHGRRRPGWCIFPPKTHLRSLRRHRPGDNLFGDSLVCVDLKTGQRKWHFQIVHHPIWDYDMSSAPILADIVVDGRPIKAVAQPTKQSILYVFDRVTGKPVWPINETPVPQSTVPGEKTSPTQPIPTKPPAYARNWFNVPNDVIDFTPEMQAQGLEQLKRYKTGPLFNPPVLGSVMACSAGSASAQPGAARTGQARATIEMRVLLAGGEFRSQRLPVAPPPPGFSDIRYIQGVDGRSRKASDRDSAGRRLAAGHRGGRRRRSGARRRTRAAPLRRLRSLRLRPPPVRIRAG